MPASILTIRLILGALAAGFACMFGQSWLRLRKGRAKRFQTMAWAFRTMAALGGTLWHSRTDWVAIGAVILAALAFGLGVYLEWRPKRQEEDLTDIIFPKS
jgi:hypothetical protein